MGWRKRTDPKATSFLRQAALRQAEEQLAPQVSSTFGLDDDMQVQPGVAFKATMQGGPPGAVGQVGIAIFDLRGNVVQARTTAGIIEAIPNSGIYVASLISPAAAGQYMLVWDDGLTPPEFGTQDLLVTPTPGDVPAPPSGADETLPCNLWITGADILSYCPSARESGVTAGALDDFAAIASELLYRLSGRQFPGVCSKTVRPCRLSCSCDWRILAWYNSVTPGFGGSYGWGNGYWNGEGGKTCGCGVLSRVRLPGYPVRSITQVSVDGNIIDPQFYRLDNRRYLTAVRRGGSFTAWPTCQDMSLPDSPGLGVFLVSFDWGQPPPILGVKAALELGCQLGMALLDQDTCTLPPGTLQVQRQGVTINRSGLSAYIAGQTTGLPDTDAFLAAYNPHRLNRRSAVWSPDGQSFSRPIGS